MSAHNAFTSALFALCAAILAFASPPLTADEAKAGHLSLAPMFGHNAVLQRDVPLPVWGTAVPDSVVEIGLFPAREQNYEAQVEVLTNVVVGTDGRWTAVLPAFSASTDESRLLFWNYPRDSYEAVKGTKAHPEVCLSSLLVTNVLFGDVWLCSGQSNMDMNYGWGLTRGKEDIETNVYDRIRLFDDPNALSFTPLDTLSKPAEWTPCDFAHAKSFSAVGYFFAQALQRGVGFPFPGKDREHCLGDVPIGLIEATWSGSPICTWLSGEAYSGADSEFAAKYDALVKSIAEPAPGKKPPQLSFWTPAASYNAMLHPLFPMAMKGAIWYQGCSDVNRPDLYEKLFRALVADWRAHFTHPDGFPVFLVQLASIDVMHEEPVESNWAWMRWTQMCLGETVDKCGTAVIIDIDEHKEMHPKDKKTVGERLARLALVRAYAQTNVIARASSLTNSSGRVIWREYRPERLVEAGPIPLKAECKDGKVVISFKNAEGLKTSDGKRLRGFQLKEENGDSAFWQGDVLGETVVIRIPGDCRPVRVRYAWDDVPDCNLVNGDDLPCGPFELAVR